MRCMPNKAEGRKGTSPHNVVNPSASPKWKENPVCPVVIVDLLRHNAENEPGAERNRNELDLITHWKYPKS